jgi:hypothetical protein
MTISFEQALAIVYPMHYPMPEPKQPVLLLGSMPRCEDCEHGVKVVDPFSTGDRGYSEIECVARSCPWGKI